jgi:hypothetical protein
MHPLNHRIGRDHRFQAWLWRPDSGVVADAHAYPGGAPRSTRQLRLQLPDQLELANATYASGVLILGSGSIVVSA